MSTLPVVVTASNTSGLTTTANAVITVNDVAPVSLFTTQTPANPNYTDGPTYDYEFGMRFSSSVNGTITGIRYWRAASETGTHTGRIWSSTGTLLASVVFTGDTGSGWKTQALASPLAITAGTTYVVSVNANVFYAYSGGGFNAAISNPPLSASIGAGRFNDNAAAFPDGLFDNENYFRDVVFVPGAAVPLQPPVVTNGSFNITAGAGTVGTMSATNSPTSWAITAGNSAGYFSISSAGVITTTAALAAGSYSLTCRATNSAGNGTGTAAISATQTVSGSPQYPALLNGYTLRPPFQVAGVDFYVGLPSSQTLAAPTTLSGTGVSVNSSIKAVTLSGSNNITIQGIDFTNWQLEVMGSGTYTVNNCKFEVGSTNQICIEGLFCTGSVSVTNCTFNGNNTVSPCAIRLGCNGNIQSNWFNYCPDDTLNVANPQGRSISITYRNNLTNNSGAGDYHSDGLQTFNSTGDTGAIVYLLHERNTFYQPSNVTTFINSAIRVGDQIRTTTVPVSNVIIRENVVIFPTLNQQSATIFDISTSPGGASSALKGVTIHDNYLDATGLGTKNSIGVYYYVTGNTPRILNAASYLNYNMKTGAVDLSGWTSGNNRNAAPANPPPAPGISSNVRSGSTVQFTGTSSASGLNIIVVDTATDIPIAEATSTTGGAWSVTTGALASGSYNFVARANDNGRNSSAPSATVSNAIP